MSEQCVSSRCDKKPMYNGRCLEHLPDFKGLGVIRCDACQKPLRDHPLTHPCPMAALPTLTARETALG